MVRCQALNERGILEALRRGMFYSSTGPAICDVGIDGTLVHIRTSPVTSITFVADNGNGERWTAISGNPITEAYYALRGDERFLRVECQDANGNCAWTNPILFTRNC